MMLFRSSTRSLLIAHNLQCPPRTTHTLGPATRFVRIRQFHRTQLVTARKSSQDKDSINRDSIEYTRSGTDEQISRLDEAAYDPNSASPEEQQKKAAAGSNESPLDYSPANPDVSATRPDGEGGPEHAPGERGVGSGGGSGKKNKKPQ